MAERVKHIAEEERSVQGELDYHTGEHILVCISAAQSNAKVIRAAARLAYAFRLPVHRIVCGDIGDAGGRYPDKRKTEAAYRACEDAGS